jgi:hypothetical protein
MSGTAYCLVDKRNLFDNKSELLYAKFVPKVHIIMVILAIVLLGPSFLMNNKLYSIHQSERLSILIFKFSDLLLLKLFS